jgi:hypothetical protein
MLGLASIQVIVNKMVEIILADNFQPFKSKKYYPVVSFPYSAL